MGFPQTIPADQVRRVIEHIKGNKEGTPALIEDCYDIVGYGLFVAIGTQNPVIRGSIPDSLDAKVALLESAILTQGAVDWKSITLMILELIKQLLQK